MGKKSWNEVRDDLIAGIKSDPDGAFDWVYRIFDSQDIELEIYDPLEHKAVGDRW